MGSDAAELERIASSADFYRRLPAFRDFAEITRGDRFRPLPDDWVLFLTDVVGSTAAIEAGRYKDVNLIGAATISAVLQLAEGDLPYVFGGDGATVAVPPDRRRSVAEALLGLTAMAREAFDLDLRLGAIGVGDLRAAGGEVAVARHELEEGRCMAVFSGGGLGLADRLVKAEPERYACAEAPDTSLALTGLSCRWDQIPASRGCSLSLLVQAVEPGAAATYDRALAFLAAQFGGRLETANPVQLEAMRYRSVRACLRDERRYHRRWASLAYAWRAFEILVSVALFGSGLARRLPVFGRYSRSMRTHADYRKFDDMLRMVLDCSPAQADAIEAWLAFERAEGKLRYGLHRASASLMTCYVEGLAPGQHIHFVDGADGGYAMAAKQLKAQLADDAQVGAG